MRWMFLGLAIVGFVLFDMVAIVALANMLGWSNISGEILVCMLGAGAIAFGGGLTGLHWSLPVEARR